jgi:hypothetical protein
MPLAAGICVGRSERHGNYWKREVVQQREGDGFISEKGDGFISREDQDSRRRSSVSLRSRLVSHGGPLLDRLPVCAFSHRAPPTCVFSSWTSGTGEGFDERGGVCPRGDPQQLAKARADALRDIRSAALRAQAVVAQNNRDAVELLELVARAS